MVHTVPFSVLQTMQLGPALVEKIKEAENFAQARTLGATSLSKSMDFDFPLLGRDHNVFSQHRFPKLRGRPPDAFLDNPEVDIHGKRHFSNGRKFDLAKTNIKDVINEIDNSPYDLK